MNGGEGGIQCECVGVGGGEVGRTREAKRETMGARGKKKKR